MNVDTLIRNDGSFRLCNQGNALKALAVEHVTHLQRDSRTVAMRKSNHENGSLYTVSFNDRTEFQSQHLNKAADKVVDYLNRGKHDWEANDSVDIWVNQADREGTVLAVIGTKVLVEYEMPAGTTAMLVFDATYYELRHRTNVAYSTCPQRWIDEMHKHDMEWLGMGQRRPAHSPEPMPPVSDKYPNLKSWAAERAAKAENVCPGCGTTAMHTELGTQYCDCCDYHS